MLPSTSHALMLGLSFLHKIMPFSNKALSTLTFSRSLWLWSYFFKSLPWISPLLTEEAWIDHWEQTGGGVHMSMWMNNRISSLTPVPLKAVLLAATFPGLCLMSTCSSTLHSYPGGPMSFPQTWTSFMEGLMLWFSPRWSEQRQSS